MNKPLEISAGENVLQVDRFIRYAGDDQFFAIVNDDLFYRLGMDTTEYGLLKRNFIKGERN